MATIRAAGVASAASPGCYHCYQTQQFGNFAIHHGPATILYWLLRIARNRCLDHLRSPATRLRDVAPADLDACTCGCAPVPEELPALRTLEQQEMSQCVQDRLATLSEEHRTVLILFDVLGQTHAEIAETLGLSAGNAKVRLHRARRAARAVLQSACTVTRDERDVLVCVPRERL